MSSCKTSEYLTCATPVWQSNTTCVDLQEKLYESISCMVNSNCSQTLLDYWCGIYETNNYTSYECNDLRCYRSSGCFTIDVNLMLTPFLFFLTWFIFT